MRRGTRTTPLYSPISTPNSTACCSAVQRASSGKEKNIGASDRDRTWGTAAARLCSARLVFKAGEGARMRRRELLLGATAMMAARPVCAQQQAMPVIGFLGPFPPSVSAQIELEQAAFRRGLSE